MVLQALQGPFTDVLEGTVKKDSFLYKWLDYLSFALRWALACVW